MENYILSTDTVKLSANNAPHIEDYFHPSLPSHIVSAIKAEYVSKFKQDRANANNYLIAKADNQHGYVAKINSEAQVKVFLSDSEIRERADRLSIQCRMIDYREDYSTQAKYEFMLQVVLNAGIDEDRIKQHVLKNKETGIVEYIHAVKRMASFKWWKKTLRTLQDKEQEHNSIVKGYVGKQASHYISPSMFSLKAARQEQAIEMLKATMIINKSTGECFSLYSAVEKSLSNPANKRAELMVKLKGVEAYANGLGLEGMFYTITAPSKYHPSSKKYEGFTPKQTQDYMNETWQLIRAVLAKNEIKLVGLRTAEPHKDGCPHWHLIVFVKPEEKHLVTETIKAYALAEDGTEQGALKNRFESVEISKDKGSAVAYIAKYISKNIDGFGINEQGANKAAQSVRMWASVWGIRQFQTFGLPSSTVWRQLRTVKEPIDGDDKLEAMRLAAHNNNYEEYINLQGGFFVPRKDRYAITVTTPKLDDDGNPVLNDYLEIVEQVTGIETKNVFIKTKNEDYTIEYMGKPVDIEGAVSDYLLSYEDVIKQLGL